MQWARAGVASLAWWVLLCAGCSPGRFIAGQMLRAPNSFPAWLAPAAPVEFTVPDPGEHARTLPVEVGPPPARLHVRIVEPGDYRLRFESAWRRERGREVFRFRARAELPPGPLAGGASPKGTVFVLHGYSVSQESMLPWALALAESGYRTVAVDLRGHGASTGRRIGLGTIEVEDLRQVLDRLAEADPAASGVGVIGESFGAALGLRWAAEDSRVKAVVAMAPYAELEPAVLGLASEYAAWLPRAWVRSAVRRVPALLGVESETLDTSPVVPRVGVPALYVAAGRDQVAPMPDVARLARLHGGPVRYLPVIEATHETLPFHFQALRAGVVDWFDRHLGPAGR